MVNHELCDKVKVLANEDTLLPTQMFPRLPGCAKFVADTNFVSGTQKMFLILFRNILCPQQMFPSLRSPRNIMSNNVSATMCPRLPVPLGRNLKYRSIAVNAVCKLEQLNNFSVYYSLFTHRLQRYVILNVFSNADQLTL